MNISIRQAAVTDFDAIYALFLQFAVFQKTPEKVLISVEQLKADQDLFKCLVAETDDGEIVGFASYFFAYYSWSGKALYLDDLYVSPNFRGYGLGNQLLQAVVALAREQQCKQMRWLVSSWNETAISFYKKIGAEIDTTDMCCTLKLTH